MKQMPLPVAHRRWLFSAVWATLLVFAEIVVGFLGSPAVWVLPASVPLAVIHWVGWWKTRPPRPRPDYALIAALERELLGVEPRVRWVGPMSFRRGGHESSDRTIHDLPPFPDAMTERGRG